LYFTSLALNVLHVGTNLHFLLSNKENTSIRNDWLSILYSIDLFFSKNKNVDILLSTHGS